MTSIKALVSEIEGSSVTSKIKTLTPPPKLNSGEVRIQVEYSSLNYKDALGITGKGKIFRTFPLVGGIDAAGSVMESDANDFKPADKVLVTGCGLGEEINGGYSEQVIVPAASVILIPKTLTTEESMILGTAGFTAALSLWRMFQNNQTPTMGPVVVTGASGGVGSFSIALLKKLGFSVIAVSGRKEQHSYLKKLGADEVLLPEELQLGSRPLESVRFGGAIDNVGGEFMAALCRHIQLWGNVACVGLASSHEFQSTLMPHILRGVSLLGISSNNCPRPLREEIWEKLAQQWNLKESLQHIHHSTIELAQLLPTAERLLSRQLFGRVLIKM